MKDWILFHWQKKNAYVERQVWKIEKKSFEITLQKVEMYKWKQERLKNEKKKPNKERVEEKWRK